MAEYHDRSTGQLHKMTMCSTPSCGNVASHLSWTSTKEEDPIKNMHSEPSPTCPSCTGDFIGRVDALKSHPDYKNIPLHANAAAIKDVLKSNPKNSADISLEQRRAIDATEVDASKGKKNLRGNYRGTKTPRKWDPEAARNGKTVSSHTYLHERRSPAQGNRILNDALAELKKYPDGNPRKREALNERMTAIREANNTTMAWANRVAQQEAMDPKNIRPYKFKQKPGSGSGSRPDAADPKPKKKKKS